MALVRRAHLGLEEMAALRLEQLSSRRFRTIIRQGCCISKSTTSVCSLNETEEKEVTGSFVILR
jgi:hypothetical protein